MSSGLDVLMGGKAKSGVVRALARGKSCRLTDLAEEVSMSKSTVLKAVQQLEGTGAVITIRTGREIFVETSPAARLMFAALVGFERQTTAPEPVMPNPGTPLSDTEREDFAALLASCSTAHVPDHEWHDDELTSGIAPGWEGRDPIE